jgi:CTP:molybdopterin cytidylyltransferase MocA
LQRALQLVGDPVDAPVRALVAAAGDAALVPDSGGWGRDCDTWDDLAAAQRRLEKRR